MWDILNLFGHAGKFYFYQEKVREFWKLMSLATMHITDTDDSVKLSRTTVALISSGRECSNNFQMLHSSEENLTRIWWLKSASNGFLSLLKMMCKSFLDLPLFVILLRSWGILKTRILSNTVSHCMVINTLRAESPSIFLENIGILSRKIEGDSARRVGDLMILWIKTFILEKKIFQSFIRGYIF